MYVSADSLCELHINPHIEIITCSSGARLARRWSCGRLQLWAERLLARRCETTRLHGPPLHPTGQALTPVTAAASPVALTVSLMHMGKIAESLFFGGHHVYIYV